MSAFRTDLELLRDWTACPGPWTSARAVSAPLLDYGGIVETLGCRNISQHYQRPQDVTDTAVVLSWRIVGRGPGNTQAKSLCYATRVLSSTEPVPQTQRGKTFRRSVGFRTGT